MIFGTLFTLFIAVPFYGILIYIIVLLVKALRKYLKSADVRKEKSETKKTLGEELKTCRANCKIIWSFS